MTFSRLWTIARLELLQRVRTVSWYVLLGVFGLVLLGVTALAFLAYGGWGTGGPGVYSVVVYVTLLLILLVSPTLSGNSINGDRDAATLAPVQVTLATTGEILFGKFLAAWITGLAFAAVAAPFLVLSTLAGEVNPWAVVTSLVILVVETGVIAGIGVALSGILSHPLFSVAVTYLVVAALAVGNRDRVRPDRHRGLERRGHALPPARLRPVRQPRMQGRLERLLRRAREHDLRRVDDEHVPRAAVRLRVVDAVGEPVRHPRRRDADPLRRAGQPRRHVRLDEVERAHRPDPAPAREHLG
ncbi:ABC transporter permease [Microbacterium lacticum]